MTPESVGLPGGSRRRVPGLRREELAQLAGISVEYYQRLEQGRSQRPSPEVLNALARALSLDEVERAHLETLAIGPDHDSPAHAETRVRPELERLLALMDRVPAMVINDRFDVLAANALAARLFADVLAEEGNLARYLFLDPAARDFYVTWEEVAAATAAQLRLVSGRHPRDRELAGLVADLSGDSAEFRALWAGGDVELRTSGVKDLRHPALGVLTLHYENFDAPGDPRQRLVTLTPAAHTATEAALQLLRTWAWADGSPAQDVLQAPAQTGAPGPGLSAGITPEIR